MAIDTRDKRAACLRIARPWMGCGPLPDGSFATVEDRRYLGYCYGAYGIVIPPGTEVGAEYVLPSTRLHYALDAKRMHYVLPSTRTQYELKEEHQ